MDCTQPTNYRRDGLTVPLSYPGGGMGAISPPYAHGGAPQYHGAVSVAGPDLPVTAMIHPGIYAAQGFDLQPALFVAAQTNNVKSLKLLLSTGARITCVDSHCQTLLHRVVIKYNSDHHEATMKMMYVQIPPAHRTHESVVVEQLASNWIQSDPIPCSRLPHR